MGREIRRVAKDWQHPREDRRGSVAFRPLHEGGRLSSAQAEWDAERAAVLAGRSEFYKTVYEHTEDCGARPDAAEYMPAWSDDIATHFQIYETVSEGTPVSPVFASRDEVATWLMGTGVSRVAAEAFAKDGWAPSFVTMGNQMASNFEALALLKRDG